MKFTNYSSDEEKELAFDLRQGYAEIVMFHWKDVIMQRKTKNFPKYFEAIEDLHTVVKHKFRKPEYERQYQEKIVVAKAFFQLHEDVYTKKRHDDTAIAQIMEKLRDIEEFLWQKTDEANIYGGKYEDEGL